FEAYDNLNNSIKENITNMRVVKSYVKLKQHLPDTLVIGISHQPKIKALFDSSLNLNEKII
ncbi:MAG: hypothetical protein KHZ64_04120, partial [Neisseria mucosa]|nr:hypothetical protein [Neisseria mucosa]